MNQIKFGKAFFFLLASGIAFVACQKESATTASEDTSSDIAVVASASAAIAGTTADSVYIHQPCNPGVSRDSVAAADLPAAITEYLTANYAGYTFHKAFALVDSSGANTGYAVIIFSNDKPVGLLFDSAGTFIKVLEQRKHRGGGHH